MSNGCSTSGLNCTYLNPYIKLKLVELAIKEHQKFEIEELPNKLKRWLFKSHDKVVKMTYPNWGENVCGSDVWRWLSCEARFPPMSWVRLCAASFPGPFPWLPAPSHPKSGKKDLGTILRSCGEVWAAPGSPAAGNRACSSNESDCTIQFTWDVEFLTFFVTCGT